MKRLKIEPEALAHVERFAEFISLVQTREGTLSMLANPDWREYLELDAWLSCADFPDAPGCCDSCHWDDEHGYGEMFEVPIDGAEGYVCCKVTQWLDDLEDPRTALRAPKQEEE